MLSPSSALSKLSLLPRPARFLPDVLFSPEDEGIRLTLNYTALQPEDCCFHSHHHENQIQHVEGS
jgi:hypothetical protein